MKNRSITFMIFIVGFTLIFALTEYFFKTGPNPAVVDNPSVALFLVILFASILAIWGLKTGTDSLGESQEATLFTDKTTDNSIDGVWKSMLQKLTKTKPITEEETILLDHNYDGIKELDNSLPPWWLYSFYISIVFAALYLGYYHILGGATQTDEFERQMEIARAEVEQYKKENPSTFDASTITASGNTDAGKKLFKTNCAVCHAVDGGGGIGPNLTDAYWVLGGGVKNIYNTIAEGGRDGKGMIAWKNSLNPEKMQQVTSYIMSLQGTTPKKPKEKEGELWTEE